MGQERKALEYMIKAQELDPEDKIDVKRIRDIIVKNKKAKEAVSVSKMPAVIEPVKPQQNNNVIRKKN